MRLKPTLTWMAIVFAASIAPAYPQAEKPLDAISTTQAIRNPQRVVPFSPEIRSAKHGRIVLETLAVDAVRFTLHGTSETGQAVSYAFTLPRKATLDRIALASAPLHAIRVSANPSNTTTIDLPRSSFTADHCAVRSAKSKHWELKPGCDPYRALRAQYDDLQLLAELIRAPNGWKQELKNYDPQFVHTALTLLTMHENAVQKKLNTTDFLDAIFVDLRLRVEMANIEAEKTRVRTSLGDSIEIQKYIESLNQVQAELDAELSGEIKPKAKSANRSTQKTIPSGKAAGVPGQTPQKTPTDSTKAN